MSNVSVFMFESHEVRSIIDEKGEPYFVAKDICEVLDITWNGDKVTLSQIREEWKQGLEIQDPNGRFQQMICINEPAVYKLAFRSRKPEAERFTDWVAGEVIPSIRKTGKYDSGCKPDMGHIRHDALKNITIELKSTNAVISLVSALKKTEDPDLREILYEQLEHRLGRPVARPKKEQGNPSLFDKQGGAL